MQQIEVDSGDAWTSGDLEYTISPLLANTGYDIQVLAESDEGMSEQIRVKG